MVEERRRAYGKSMITLEVKPHLKDLMRLRAMPSAEFNALLVRATAAFESVLGLTPEPERAPRTQATVTGACGNAACLPGSDTRVTPYRPTPSELIELGDRTELVCRSCSNTGVVVMSGIRCVCLRLMKPGPLDPPLKEPESADEPRLLLEDPCPHPGRHGCHELYCGLIGDSQYCRACGARES